MTEAEIETRNLQTWLEVRSTALARKLRAGNDPVLLEEKAQIQQQLITVAQEIEAAHERNENGTGINSPEQNMDENGTGAGSGRAG